MCLFGYNMIDKVVLGWFRSFFELLLEAFHEVAATLHLLFGYLFGGCGLLK